MELLQLILLKSAYPYFNFYDFINLIILFIFFKIIYNKKISMNENGDPIIIISNLLYIFLHLSIILLYQINDYIRGYQVGRYILSYYDKYNNKYLYYRIKIISFPILFLIKRVINNKYKPNKAINLIHYNINTKLKTDKDVSNFLNKLSKKLN
jgi:hypothetical protein